MGIEPTSSAWKAEVLPLNYTRLVKPRFNLKPAATPKLNFKRLYNMLYKALYPATIYLGGGGRI